MSLIASGVISGGILLGCSRIGPPPSVQLELKTYDIDRDHDVVVLIWDGKTAARFCGCEPCVKIASEMTPHQQAKFQIVTFTGTKEGLIEFRDRVNWKWLKLIETDQKWSEAWSHKSCPLFGRYSADQKIFVEEPITR